MFTYFLNILNPYIFLYILFPDQKSKILTFPDTPFSLREIKKNPESP